VEKRNERTESRVGKAEAAKKNEWMKMAPKQWLFDPDSGGKKIREANAT